MYFNSYIFVLAFLPVVLAGYYLMNRTKKYRWGQLWLIASSFFFIGYMNIWYILFTLIFTVSGYGFVFLVTQRTYKDGFKKKALVTGIVFHTGTLLFFKYSNFFLENVNGLLKKEIPLLEILLPIGISFYTFQQIAYLVDCYRKPEVKGTFLEYVLYITFFSQFLQGPILLHEDMLPQLRDTKNKQFCAESFSKGLYAFSLGLGKKVLLADNIAYIVNAGYGNIEYLNSPSAFLTMVAYSLQLYFDFSGYCDMALGLGEMFQIRMPINFNSPYKAVKIAEIWDRWHITLTRFFTRYVYIPLGGSRRGTVRMYGNTLLVFLLSGLWHGAAWTFIIWGALHGIAMIISKFLDRARIILPKAIGWLGTFLFWVMSFAIFRAASWEEAKALFDRLLHGGMGRVSEELVEAMDAILEVRIMQRLDIVNLLERFPGLVPVFFVIVPLVACLFMKNTQEKMNEFKTTYSKLFVTILLLFYSIISFGGMNVFLYVNF